MTDNSIVNKICWLFWLLLKISSVSLEKVPFIDLEMIKLPYPIQFISPPVSSLFNVVCIIIRQSNPPPRLERVRVGHSIITKRMKNWADSGKMYNIKIHFGVQGSKDLILHFNILDLIVILLINFCWVSNYPV